MQKVTGLGGCFFRTKNPKELSKWYEVNFGINDESTGTMWQQEAGITVFSPFASDSDYFPETQQVMFNFRVDDLDAMVEQLKKNGVKIDEKRQDEAYGRFAWVYDPEGNKIELWQPIDEQ